MKVNPIRIAAVVSRLWPIVREFIDALDRRSDGGKRITAAERGRILDVALGQTRDVLDQYAEQRGM